jgi:two-component system, cell cycle response regulator
METPIIDPATGLWSAAQLITHLTREFARAADAGVAVSIAVADVDDFAAITRSSAPDERVAILRQVGARLRRSLRKSDAIGRYAGEEFLIVFDPTSRGQTGPIDPCLVMERIRKAVSDRAFETLSGPVNITVSAGAATGTPGLDDPAGLIASAIQALWRAKVEGNCVHVSSATVGV